MTERESIKSERERESIKLVLVLGASWETGASGILPQHRRVRLEHPPLHERPMVSQVTLLLAAITLESLTIGRLNVFFWTRMSLGSSLLLVE